MKFKKFLLGIRESLLSRLETSVGLGLSYLFEMLQITECLAWKKHPPLDSSILQSLK